jgi:hypothetical protein
LFAANAKSFLCGFSGTYNSDSVIGSWQENCCPLRRRKGPTKPGEPELKLPNDADVDKMISLLENFWRRLIEMVTTVQKDAEKKN